MIVFLLPVSGRLVVRCSCEGEVAGAKTVLFRTRMMIMLCRQGLYDSWKRLKVAMGGVDWGVDFNRTNTYTRVGRHSEWEGLDPLQV